MSSKKEHRINKARIFSVFSADRRAALPAFRTLKRTRLLESLGQRSTCSSTWKNPRSIFLERRWCLLAWRKRKIVVILSHTWNHPNKWGQQTTLLAVAFSIECAVKISNNIVGRWERIWLACVRFCSFLHYIIHEHFAATRCCVIGWIESSDFGCV